MKKRLGILLALFLVIFNSVSAFAETITFSDAYMTLDIDTALYDIVFTPDAPVDETLLSSMELTQEEFNKFFTEQGIMLDAIVASPYFETSVTVREDENSKYVFNLNELSDNEISNSLIEEIKNSFGSDLTCYSTKLETHNDIKMILMDFSFNTKDPVIYARSYATIFNGKYINLNFYTYDKKDFDKFNDNIINIVNSISFSKTLENPNKGNSTFTKGLSETMLSGIISGTVVGIFVLIIIVFKKKCR